jgi:hypothetical protein
MASVNNYNPRTDTTVQIFDRFYGYQEQVPVDQYDSVHSYFLSVFQNTESANNFTVALFRISRVSGTPVMTLLQQLQGQSAPQLSLTLSYYLNGLNSSSTLLGINVPTQPNYYVEHNIRI